MFSYSGNSGDLCDGNRRHARCRLQYLSCQTGFPSYFCDDYTDRMDKFMDEWKNLDFQPDGIYTGFLADAAQADKVASFIEQFGGENVKILVDPVMGDDGEGASDLHGSTL